MRSYCCSDGMCGAEDCRKCGHPPQCSKFGALENEDNPLDRTYAEELCLKCFARENDETEE